MYQKRILWLSEFSGLHTGFSNIGRIILPKLCETGKYIVAEHASYVDCNHPEINNFVKGRWKVYPGLPSTQEEGEKFKQYIQCPRSRTKGQNTSQFNEWNFNEVVADFKPDILISNRDWWMDEFVEDSPFRSWFKWIWMPTVDSPDQDELWINSYEKVNLCLAYSDFGLHTLKLQGPKIKLFPKPMRPGVDIEVFKPLNKSEIREKYNLAKDIPIIGMVQRNQSRKLILELIDAFALMKNKYKGNTKVDKSVLLMHTSWPDNAHSFDYPRHIYRLETHTWNQYHKKGIRGDVLQTMLCAACKEPSITYAMNLLPNINNGWNMPIPGNRVKLLCPYCGKQECSPPNTGFGITREQLADIYNLMDLFVQCSIAEGCGMPVQEAKSCGVPVLVTDHSATAEKGRFPSEYVHFKENNITENNYTTHLGGEVIDVAAYRHEPETGCLRAVPDVKDLADKMYKFITDDDYRKKKSEDALICAKENYDWDKIAKQWEFILDNVKPLDRSSTWDSPIEIVEDIKSSTVPAGLLDQDYVYWLYLNILKYPSVDFDGAKMWIQYLQQGLTREQLMQQFVSIGNQQSDAYKVRNRIRAQIQQKNNGNAIRHNLEII